MRWLRTSKAGERGPTSARSHSTCPDASECQRRPGRAEQAPGGVIAEEGREREREREREQARDKESKREKGREGTLMRRERSSPRSTTASSSRSGSASTCPRSQSATPNFSCSPPGAA
eukprot:834736-Rhodomonas_salina.1